MPRDIQAILEWEEKEHERQKALASATGGRDQAEVDVVEEQFVSYVALPDSKAIELKVLEKKKQELMSKYATEEFRSQQEEAKSLLNKK